MGIKEKFSMDFSALNPLHNRRIQRIALFAACSILLVGAGLYRHKIYPTVPSAPSFHLDSITGLHKDTSSPRQNQTKLPFINDEDRKTTEEAFLTIPETTYTIPKIPIDPSLTALDHTRVALLIETRVIPHVPALLLHFISVIPLQWTVRFMGSVPALEIIESSRALQMYIKTGKLLLIDIPEGLPVTTQQGLSEVFTSLEFYKDLMAPAEWLLIFQSDSIICSASELSLDDWVEMGYTYVGAPWEDENVAGGNGGLSLRHVPSIIDLLSDPDVPPREKDDEQFEDVWLGHQLKERFASSMPSAEIERHFSVESVWSERPMGYHLRGSGKYLDDGIWGNTVRRTEIFKYCPEVKIILSKIM